MTDEIVFQDGGEIKEYVVPRSTLFVAVFYYMDSNVPFGTTNTDKEGLMKSMLNWNGLDRTRPVRIYTITL